MNPNNLKKSLLNYAIGGNLSSNFRKENPSLSAFEEIEAYNQKIKHLKSQREQWKNNLEKLSKQTKEDSKKQRIKHILTKLNKRISSYQTITPINADGEAPFEIPETWAWVRLGEICDINPKNNIEDSVDVSFIPMTLISDNFKNTFTSEFRKWKDVKKNFSHLMNNAIAFAKITPCFQNQKSVILKNLKNGYGAGTTELIVLLPKNTKILNFLYFLINSPYFIQNGEKEMTGTAGQQRVPTEFVRNFLIPFPPLEEQKFIVNEIKKLLSHTQDFESKAQQLRNLENTLSSFVDKSLLNYAIEGNLSSNFRKENPSLSAFEEIEAYNQKIKHLKSQREQWKNNLEKLSKQTKEDSKKQRIKHILTKLNKRISSYQTITPINADGEAPFEIPETWAWVRLGGATRFFTGNSINKIEKETKFTNVNGIPYIGTKDIIKNGEIQYQNGIAIPTQYLQNFRIAPRGSVLLCIEGGSAGKKVAITTQKVCFGNKLCCFDSPILKNTFLLIFFNSTNFYEIFNSLINGIIGGVNQGNIANIPIPLPPLEEQRFIVNEMERLLSLCLKIKEIV